MGTVAPPLVRKLADDWKSKCGLKSAVFSGIVAGGSHVQSGYHVGRDFQPSSNYSVVRPDDREGPGNAAAAIDMTMNASDMRVCTRRLVAVFENLSDPRRKYLNAFNGTLDGKTAKRWDVYARKVKSATRDHLEHVHLELRRKYVGSVSAMAAVLSALKGETVAQYLAWAAPGGSVSSAKTLSTVAAPPFPGVLRRADQQKRPNAHVKVFQTQLIKRGLTSIGSPDGYFGPKLETAVKAWQKRQGLGADGVVGPKTWPTAWAGK
jgi:hypothetical protein